MFNAFRTNLASARASSVMDFVDEFKDKCDFWIAPISYYYAISKTLEANKKYCITGSVILGANASFKATPYFTKISDEKLTIEASDEIENPVAIVGSIDINLTASEKAEDMVQTFLEPITIIAPSQPLKIQYVIAQPSAKLSGKFGKMSYDVGSKSTVSTKRTGDSKISFSAKGSETSVKGTVETLYSISNKNLTYKYKRDKYIDFIYSGSAQYPSSKHADKEGTIGASIGAMFMAAPGEVDLIAEGEARTSLSGDVEFTWEETAKASADEEDDKLLIPEFTATLSTKGGAFTESNVDQKFDGGLPWWGILLIVLAVIIVIAVVVVVVLFLFVFKKGDSKSGGNDDKV